MRVFQKEEMLRHDIKIYMLACKDHPLQCEIYLGKDVGNIETSAHVVVLCLITKRVLQYKAVESYVLTVGIHLKS